MIKRSLNKKNKYKQNLKDLNIFNSILLKKKSFSFIIKQRLKNVSSNNSKVKFIIKKKINFLQYFLTKYSVLKFSFNYNRFASNTNAIKTEFSNKWLVKTFAYKSHKKPRYKILKIKKKNSLKKVLFSYAKLFLKANIIHFSLVYFFYFNQLWLKKNSLLTSQNFNKSIFVNQQLWRCHDRLNSYAKKQEKKKFKKFLWLFFSILFPLRDRIFNLNKTRKSSGYIYLNKSSNQVTFKNSFKLLNKPNYLKSKQATHIFKRSFVLPSFFFLRKSPYFAPLQKLRGPCREKKNNLFFNDASPELRMALPYLNENFKGRLNNYFLKKKNNFFWLCLSRIKTINELNIPQSIFLCNSYLRLKHAKHSKNFFCYWLLPFFGFLNLIPGGDAKQKENFFFNNPCNLVSGKSEANYKSNYNFSLNKIELANKNLFYTQEFVPIDLTATLSVATSFNFSSKDLKSQGTLKNKNPGFNTNNLEYFLNNKDARLAKRNASPEHSLNYIKTGKALAIFEKGYFYKLSNQNITQIFIKNKSYYASHSSLYKKSFLFENYKKKEKIIKDLSLIYLEYILNTLIKNQALAKRINLLSPAFRVSALLNRAASPKNFNINNSASSNNKGPYELPSEFNRKPGVLISALLNMAPEAKSKELNSLEVKLKSNILLKNLLINYVNLNKTLPRLEWFFYQRSLYLISKRNATFNNKKNLYPEVILNKLRFKSNYNFVNFLNYSKWLSLRAYPPEHSASLASEPIFSQKPRVKKTDLFGLNFFEKSIAPKEKAIDFSKKLKASDSYINNFLRGLAKPNKKKENKKNIVLTRELILFPKKILPINKKKSIDFFFKNYAKFPTLDYHKASVLLENMLKIQKFIHESDKKKKTDLFGLNFFEKYIAPKKKAIDFSKKLKASDSYINIFLNREIQQNSYANIKKSSLKEINNNKINTLNVLNKSLKRITSNTFSDYDNNRAQLGSGALARLSQNNRAGKATLNNRAGKATLITEFSNKNKEINKKTIYLFKKKFSFLAALNFKNINTPFTVFKSKASYAYKGDFGKYLNNKINNLYRFFFKHSTSEGNSEGLAFNFFTDLKVCKSEKIKPNNKLALPLQGPNKFKHKKESQAQTQTRKAKALYYLAKRNLSILYIERQLKNLLNELLIFKNLIILNQPYKKEVTLNKGVNFNFINNKTVKIKKNLSYANFFFLNSRAKKATLNKLFNFFYFGDKKVNGFLIKDSASLGLIPQNIWLREQKNILALNPIVKKNNPRNRIKFSTLKLLFITKASDRKVAQTNKFFLYITNKKIKHNSKKNKKIKNKLKLKYNLSLLNLRLKNSLDSIFVLYKKKTYPKWLCPFRGPCRNQNPWLPIKNGRQLYRPLRLNFFEKSIAKAIKKKLKASDSYRNLFFFKSNRLYSFDFFKKAKSFAFYTPETRVWQSPGGMANLIEFFSNIYSKSYIDNKKIPIPGRDKFLDIALPIPSLHKKARYKKKSKFFNQRLLAEVLKHSLNKKNKLIEKNYLTWLKKEYQLIIDTHFAAIKLPQAQTQKATLQAPAKRNLLAPAGEACELYIPGIDFKLRLKKKLIKPAINQKDRELNSWLASFFNVNGEPRNIWLREPSEGLHRLVATNPLSFASEAESSGSGGQTSHNNFAINKIPKIIKQSYPILKSYSYYDYACEAYMKAMILGSEIKNIKSKLGLTNQQSLYFPKSSLLYKSRNLSLKKLKNNIMPKTLLMSNSFLRSFPVKSNYNRLLYAARAPARRPLPSEFTHKKKNGSQARNQQSMASDGTFGLKKKLKASPPKVYTDFFAKNLKNLKKLILKQGLIFNMAELSRIATKKTLPLLGNPPLPLKSSLFLRGPYELPSEFEPGVLISARAPEAELKDKVYDFKKKKIFKVKNNLKKIKNIKGVLFVSFLRDKLNTKVAPGVCASSKKINYGVCTSSKKERSYFDKDLQKPYRIDKLFRQLCLKSRAPEDITLQAPACRESNSSLFLQGPYELPYEFEPGGLKAPEANSLKKLGRATGTDLKIKTLSSLSASSERAKNKLIEFFSHQKKVQIPGIASKNSESYKGDILDIPGIERFIRKYNFLISLKKKSKLSSAFRGLKFFSDEKKISSKSSLFLRGPSELPSEFNRKPGVLISALLNMAPEAEPLMVLASKNSESYFAGIPYGVAQRHSKKKESNLLLKNRFYSQRLGLNPFVNGYARNPSASLAGAIEVKFYKKKFFNIDFIAKARSFKKYNFSKWLSLRAYTPEHSASLAKEHLASLALRRITPTGSQKPSYKTERQTKKVNYATFLAKASLAKGYANKKALLNYDINNKKFIYSFNAAMLRLRVPKLNFLSKSFNLYKITAAFRGLKFFSDEKKISSKSSLLKRGPYELPSEFEPGVLISARAPEAKLNQATFKINTALKLRLKKRRALKQLRETGRLLKRKRFFPRPIWLRFIMYKKFLKCRFARQNFNKLGSAAISRFTFNQPWGIITLKNYLLHNKKEVYNNKDIKLKNAKNLIGSLKNIKNMHRSSYFVNKINIQKPRTLVKKRILVDCKTNRNLIFPNIAYKGYNFNLSKKTSLKQKRIRRTSLSYKNEQNLKRLNMSLFYFSFPIKNKKNSLFGFQTLQNNNSFNKGPGGDVFTLSKRISHSLFFPSSNFNIYIEKNFFNYVKFFNTIIFNEREAYYLSKNVLTEFKQSLLHSSWLRANLNAYLRKIKQNFKIIKKVTQITEINFLAQKAKAPISEAEGFLAATRFLGHRFFCSRSRMFWGISPKGKPFTKTINKFNFSKVPRFAQTQAEVLKGNLNHSYQATLKAINLSFLSLKKRNFFLNNFSSAKDFFKHYSDKKKKTLFGFASDSDINIFLNPPFKGICQSKGSSYKRDNLKNKTIIKPNKNYTFNNLANTKIWYLDLNSLPLQGPNRFKQKKEPLINIAKTQTRKTKTPSLLITRQLVRPGFNKINITNDFSIFNYLKNIKINFNTKNKEIEKSLINPFPIFSQNLLKWEISLKKAFFSEIIYQAKLSQIITNIKYNLSSFSLALGSIAKLDKGNFVTNHLNSDFSSAKWAPWFMTTGRWRDYQFWDHQKPSTKNNLNDSGFGIDQEPQTIKNNKSQKSYAKIWNNASKKIKKPILKDFSLFNYLNNYAKNSSIIFTNWAFEQPFFTHESFSNISKEKIYWALNKTHLSLYKNKNKKKYLWANQKQREQNRSNKTKNLINSAFILIQKPISEKYTLLTKKTLKFFVNGPLPSFENRKVRSSFSYLFNPARGGDLLDSSSLAPLKEPFGGYITKGYKTQKANLKKLNNFRSYTPNSTASNSTARGYLLKKQKQKENKLSYLGFSETNFSKEENNLILFLFAHPFTFNKLHLANNKICETKIGSVGSGEFDRIAIKQEEKQLLNFKSNIPFGAFVKKKQIINYLKNKNSFATLINNLAFFDTNKKVLKEIWFNKNGILKEHQVFLRYLKNSLRINKLLLNKNYNKLTAYAFGNFYSASLAINLHPCEADNFASGNIYSNFFLPLSGTSKKNFYSYPKLYNLQKKTNGFLQSKSYLKCRWHSNDYFLKKLKIITSIKNNFFSSAKSLTNYFYKPAITKSAELKKIPYLKKFWAPEYTTLQAPACFVLSSNSSLLKRGPYELPSEFNRKPGVLISALLNMAPEAANKATLNLKMIKKTSTIFIFIYLTFLTNIFHLCSLFSLTSSAEIRSVIKFFILFNLKITSLYLGLTRSIFLYFSSAFREWEFFSYLYSKSYIDKKKILSKDSASLGALFFTPFEPGGSAAALKKKSKKKSNAASLETAKANLPGRLYFLNSQSLPLFLATPLQGPFTEGDKLKNIASNFNFIKKETKKGKLLKKEKTPGFFVSNLSPIYLKPFTKKFKQLSLPFVRAYFIFNFKKVRSISLQGPLRERTPLFLALPKGRETFIKNFSSRFARPVSQKPKGLCKHRFINRFKPRGLQLRYPFYVAKKENNLKTYMNLRVRKPKKERLIKKAFSKKLPIYLKNFLIKLFKTTTSVYWFRNFKNLIFLNKKINDKSKIIALPFKPWFNTSPSGLFSPSEAAKKKSYKIKKSIKVNKFFLAYNSLPGIRFYKNLYQKKSLKKEKFSYTNKAIPSKKGFKPWGTIIKRNSVFSGTKMKKIPITFAGAPWFIFRLKFFFKYIAAAIYLKKKLKASNSYIFTKNNIKAKINTLNLFNSFLKIGLNISYNSYNFLLKIIEIPKTGIQSIYIFLEKPGELLSDSITHLFLIEIASDLTTTIPENTDATLWTNFTKIAKSYFFRITPILGTIIEKRLLNSVETFLEILSQPDTDLIFRQKKVSYAWDIWGELLKTVAEKNNINLSLLTSKKEDQAFLITKLLEETSSEAASSDFSSAKWAPWFRACLIEFFSYIYSKSYINKKKIQIPGRYNSTGPCLPSLKRQGAFVCKVYATQSTGSHKAITKVKIKNKNLLNSPWPFELASEFEPGRDPEAAKKSIIKRNLIWQRWAANQFMTYKGKDSDLFIQAPPASKSFRSGDLTFKTIKHYNLIQAPIYNIICQIYSGLFYKKTAKNFLVVGAASKNSNYQRSLDDEKSLLIQSLAGETEMKIIRDNANRYNFALGIQSLRNVFDALALHTPCLFLIEDIHVIGERRPLLVYDNENYSDPRNSYKNYSYTEPNDERSFSIAKLTRHVVMHYKKPFRGDYSTALPTNNYSFDLFLGINSLQTRQARLTPLSPILLEKENQTPSLQERTYHKNLFVKASYLQLSHLQQDYSHGETIMINNLRKKKEKMLTLDKTTPFSILNRVASTTTLKPKKTVKEIPWIGISEESTLSHARNNDKKQTYSIRVKVALLAHLAVSNFSVKLNMITDLLVIIDSVRANRGFVVFATTHTPSILDPALRRPGRLDETIALPFVPKLENRWEIVKSNLIGLNYSPSFFSFSSNKFIYKGIPESGFPFFVTLDLLDYGLFNNSLKISKLQALIIQEKITKFKKNLTKNSFKKENFFEAKSQTNLLSDFNYTKLSLKANRINEIFILDKILYAPHVSKLWPSSKAIRSHKRVVKSYIKQKKLFKIIETLKNNHSALSGALEEIRTPGLRLNSTGLRKNKEETKQAGACRVDSGNQPTKNLFIPGIKFKLRVNDKHSLNKIKLIKKDKIWQSHTSTLIANAYSKIGRLLINNKFAFNYRNLSLFSVLHSPLENLDLQKPLRLPYFHLYSKQENIKQILMNLFTAKVTETFAFSALSLKNYASNQENQLHAFLSSKSSAKQINSEEQSHQKMPRLGLFCLQNIDKNWRAASSIIFSYIEKQLIYKKNLLIPKLLQFYDAGIQSASLHDPPSAPSSFLLLPAKRYENYKRSFLTMQKQNAAYNGNGTNNQISLESSYQKIELHQKRILKKNLYSLFYSFSSNSKNLFNSFKHNLKEINLDPLVSGKSVPSFGGPSEAIYKSKENKNNFKNTDNLSYKNSPFFSKEELFSVNGFTAINQGSMASDSDSDFFALNQGVNPILYSNPTSINWYYRNRLLNRHRGYLNNQWWNGQLSEQNVETTFLSDVDWRSNFLSSFINKYASSGHETKKELKTSFYPLPKAEGLFFNLNKKKAHISLAMSSEAKKNKSIEQNSLLDFLIDYPDFDQHYNPRNRRWILNYGYWSYWYNYQKDYNKEIYSYMVMETFFKTYNFLNSNREILDYLVTKLIKLGLLKEITIIDGLKRF